MNICHKCDNPKGTLVLDIMTPSDAQILINTHYGNEANETASEDVFQDCNTEPVVKPDLNKNIFSYK